LVASGIDRKGVTLNIFFQSSVYLNVLLQSIERIIKSDMEKLIFIHLELSEFNIYLKDGFKTTVREIKQSQSIELRHHMICVKENNKC
jgi:hypothetical protein